MFGELGKLQKGVEAGDKPWQVDGTEVGKEECTVLSRKGWGSIAERMGVDEWKRSLSYWPVVSSKLGE